MDGQSEENLKELFEKFVSSDEAEEAAGEVRKGEQILYEHPALEPDGEVIADVKAAVARALADRKAVSFRRIAYGAAVAAAAVILLAAVSIRLFEKGNGKQGGVVTASIIPKGIWGNGDAGGEDADLAILAAEVEQIEDEVTSLQLGESGGNGHRELAELEMELIEIDSDFWKG